MRRNLPEQLNDMSYYAEHRPRSSTIIWVASESRLATYDVLTKEFKLIGNMGVTMYDIALSPAGRLFGVDSSGNNLYKINKKTAKATLVAAMDPVGFCNALTFNRNGVLYGMQGSVLITINTVTGAVTQLGDTGFVSNGDMVFFNNNLYLAGGESRLVLVDIGDPPSSVDIAGIPLTYGLAVVYISEGRGGNYHLYGTSGNDLSVYQIDPITGRISNSAVIPTLGGSEGETTNGTTSAQFE